jgi:hypothetical protein
MTVGDLLYQKSFVKTVFAQIKLMERAILLRSALLKSSVRRLITNHHDDKL